MGGGQFWGAVLEALPPPIKMPAYKSFDRFTAPQKSVATFVLKDT